MQPRSARSAMPRGLLSHLRAFLPDLLRSSLPRRFFSPGLKLGLLVALADSRSFTSPSLTLTHSLSLTPLSPSLTLTHSLTLTFTHSHFHFISYVLLMLLAFRRFSPLTGPLARFPRSSGYQSHLAGRAGIAASSRFQSGTQVVRWFSGLWSLRRLRRSSAFGWGAPSARGVAPRRSALCAASFICLWFRRPVPAFPLPDLGEGLGWGRLIQ